jgi:hypothetical protein
MQSAAKHLARAKQFNRWELLAAGEMLRCALHDVLKSSTLTAVHIFK